MTRQFPRLVWLLFVVSLAGLFAVAVTSTPPIRALLVMNSDILLPAAWVQNLLHHPETVTLFQLPRIPSFAPDLSLYVLLTAVLPSWQAVVLAYAVLSYVALILVAGEVVAQTAGRRWIEGAAAFLAVAALAQLLDMTFHRSNGAFLFIFAPVVHSGSFVLSLGGLLLAWRRMRAPGWRVTAGLVVVSVLGAVSDKLFLGSFFLPLLAGWLASGGVRRGWPAVLWAALGCGAGLMLDPLIFSQLLSRQPDFPVDWRGQIALVPAMLHDRSVQIGVALAGVAVLLPSSWARQTGVMRFWWAAGTVSVMGFLGLLPVLYADASAVRYVQPVWWWGLMVIAAAGLRWSPKLSLAGVGVGALVALAGVAHQEDDLFKPGRIVGYQSPIAECLAPLKRTGRIHAGIAQYWSARVIEASSDWQIQVPQVVGSGQVFLWGNNRSTYLHDINDLSKPPLFDFIVMQDLDAAGIRVRFGAPDEVVPCPGSDIWLYTTPGGIGANIGEIATANAPGGLLAGSSCFGPGDFYSNSGPLGLEGATAAAGAPPHDVVTHGPYVRLRSGSWTLTFRYSLDGPTTGTEDFDVAISMGSLALTSGRLEAGEHRVKVVPLTIRRDTSPLELRSWLNPGDHIQIESLTMTRAGTAEMACHPEAKGDSSGPKP